MSGKGTMKSFKKMLGEAKRPERVVDICMRGDLTAEFEAAERDLKTALEKPSDSLAGNGSGELVEKLDSLEAKMREQTYPFRLRAMPKPAFRALVAEHPPRRDPETNEVDERDRYVGVNQDTFHDALIRACLVDPELDEDDWTLLFDEKLTDNQFDALASAAWNLNRGEVSVPFSRAASLLKRATASE